MIRTLLIFSILGTLLASAPSPEPQTPTEKAWLILQRGLADKRAEKRANAVRALRLLPNNPKAQGMAENALADQNPKVRAAAVRALGPMGAVSSVPKLKAVLNDKAGSRYRSRPLALSFGRSSGGVRNRLRSVDG